MFTLHIFVKLDASAGVGNSLEQIVVTFGVRAHNPAYLHFYRVVMALSREGVVTETIADPRFSHLIEIGFERREHVLAAWRGLNNHASPQLAGFGDSMVIASEAFAHREWAESKDRRRGFISARRKPDLSLGAFRDYWRRKHPHMVLSNIVGLRGYIQHHALDDVYTTDPDSWNGLAEVWFDSLDESLAMFDTHPQEAAALAQDENAFLRDDGIEMYVVQPHQAT